MANNINVLFKLFLPLLLLCTGVRCDVQFHFRNACPYSLWRASGPSIGDLLPEMEPGTYEIFNMDDKYNGNIWVRTKCTTNATGYFSCATGDCRLGTEECAGVWPNFPATLLPILVNNPIVYYAVYVNHGQNVLVRIQPNGGTLEDGSGPCPMVECNKDFRSVCPDNLIARASDGSYVGCNHPCDVYRNDKYCCDGVRCKPDDISQQFDNLCPLAYTWLGDATPPRFRCKGADSYDITFCPSAT